MNYKQYFNATEISAVLDGFPARMRGYIWFRNFYSPPDPMMLTLYSMHGWF